MISILYSAIDIGAFDCERSKAKNEMRRLYKQYPAQKYIRVIEDREFMDNHDVKYYGRIDMDDKEMVLPRGMASAYVNVL